VKRVAIVLLILAASQPGPVATHAGAEGPVQSARARIVDGVPPAAGVEERLREIRRQIQRALVYPPVARSQALEGETLVRFEIAHGGATRDVRVFRSSGMPTLDRAAARAVAAAAPLPWVYGLLEVPVRFELDAR
jgi:TonB family protein